MNKRFVIIIVTLVTVLILVLFGGIVFYIVQNTEKNDENIIEQVPRYSIPVEEFNRLFNNTTNYQNNNLSYVNKLDTTKEIVYTNNSTNNKVSGKYDINIKIPAFNINNKTASKINQEIVDIFESKAKDIIRNAGSSTVEIVYTVDYCAYVNDNILSLAIKSTLKENDSAQRIIVKTYTYNLAANELITLNGILGIKNIDSNNVQKIINQEIELKNNETEELENAGYSVYKRDTKSKIYNIANSNCYLLGENNKIYVIYPYGNTSFTSEIDIILIN